MNKNEVLISIQPYWVFLIIAKAMGWNIGKEKTVEVRKNYPKGENWNKAVKIYCSKDKKSFTKIPKEYQPLMQPFLGKVIGGFECNEIAKYPYENFNDGEHFMPYGELKKTCLDGWELYDYLGVKDGYGWHVSNLAIYDKPKELSEFWKADKCPYVSDNGCTYACRCFRSGQVKRCGETLKRPPQSWCYIAAK